MTCNHKTIIAFAGRKRSGKGMLALGVKENNENTIIVTIADNLKNLCCRLLNVSYQKLNKMKDDGTTFNVKVDGRWVTIINEETKIEDEIICKEIGGLTFTNVRDILQVIGTDLIRKYVPNWHIDKTIERINSIDDDKIIVVDDVRFPNEKCKIEEIGGDVFFVIRPNCWDISNHPSETALKYDDFCDNNVIINDFSKNDMISFFNDMYFNNEKGSEWESVILLSCNPWYIEHMIDMKTYNTQFNIDRRAMIKCVIEVNRDKEQFLKNGIITFKSKDNKAIQLFRRVILNDRHNNDGHTCYSIYNPLTNEILKTYM